MTGAGKCLGSATWKTANPDEARALFDTDATMNSGGVSSRPPACRACGPPLDQIELALQRCLVVCPASLAEQ